MKITSLILSIGVLGLCLGCTIFDPDPVTDPTPLPLPDPAPEPGPDPIPLSPPLLRVVTDNADGLADFEASLRLSNADAAVTNQWSTNGGLDWTNGDEVIFTSPVTVTARSIAPDGAISVNVSTDIHFYSLPHYDSTISSKGYSPGQFQLPVGMAFYNHELYVNDMGNFHIQVYDTSGAYQRLWGSFGSGEGEVQANRGLDVDQGRVYIAEAGGNRIQVFDTWGNPLTLWGSSGSGPGQFSYPNGLDVEGGEVYVADQYNHRVQVFSTNGSYLRGWGGNGSLDGQFKAVADVQAYQGRVYTCDLNNNRVQVFDSQGNHQYNITGLTSPMCLSIYHDRIYIGEWNAHRVTVTTLDGRFLGSWGSLGTDPGQFNQPLGIEIADDTVYLADTLNGKVLKFIW